MKRAKFRVDQSNGLGSQGSNFQRFRMELLAILIQLCSHCARRNKFCCYFDFKLLSTTCVGGAIRYFA